MLYVVKEIIGYRKYKYACMLERGEKNRVLKKPDALGNAVTRCRVPKG